MYTGGVVFGVVLPLSSYLIPASTASLSVSIYFAGASPGGPSDDGPLDLPVTHSRVVPSDTSPYFRRGVSQSWVGPRVWRFHFSGWSTHDPWFHRRQMPGMMEVWGVRELTSKHCLTFILYIPDFSDFSTVLIQGGDKFELLV